MYHDLTGTNFAANGKRHTSDRPNIGQSSKQVNIDYIIRMKRRREIKCIFSRIRKTTKKLVCSVEDGVQFIDQLYYQLAVL